MRFGASTFIWVSPFSSETLDLIGKVADFGFDLIEICVEEPAAIDTDRIRRRLDDAGIGVTVCGAFGPHRRHERRRRGDPRQCRPLPRVLHRHRGPARQRGRARPDVCRRRQHADARSGGAPGAMGPGGRGARSRRRPCRVLRRDARVRAAEPLRDRSRQYRRPGAQTDRGHRPTPTSGFFSTRST